MKWVKLSAAAVLLFALHYLFSDQDTLIQDFFFNLRGTRQPGGEIVIAAVDESSINVVGNWPWNRAKIAELLDSLTSGSPAAIYVNLFFRKNETSGLTEAEVEKTRLENQALAGAVARSGCCILPYFFEGFGEGEGQAVVLAPKKALLNRIVRTGGPLEELKAARILHYPEPVVAEQAEALGFNNVVPRLAIQALRYGGDVYPAVSLQAVRARRGLAREDIAIESDGTLKLGNDRLAANINGLSMINFYGPGKTFPQVPAVEIMGREFDKQKLAGKIVIVGVTAPSLRRDTDSKPTAFDPALSSSEYWANIMQNTLDGSFFDYSSLHLSLWIPVCLILIAVFLMTHFSLRSPPKIQFALLGGGLSALFLISFTFFLFDRWVSVISPGIYLAGLAGLCANRRFRRGASAGPLSATNAGNTAVFTPAGKLERIGRYQILDELGSGGMGTVFRAADPVIDRTVAIKVVRSEGGLSSAPDTRERFLREAHAAGTLSHPNIITIFDYGDTGSLSYIAMEYLKGVSLEQRLSEGKPLSTEEIADIVRQVAEGLHHAHGQGVIHRDVKPANIMLVGDGGRVKIMDFGIAKVNNVTLTQTGTALGTPNYMSPEQINGNPLDHRSDIFSLAVIAYELLCGRRPFAGENLSALSYAILHQRPDKPSSVQSGLSPAVDEVLERALAKNAGERFSQAVEFAQAFGKALA